MHVVLVEPEIAPNTGAIIRLCANTGCALHLVEPLGFELTDAQLKRGGLDYHEYVNMQVHPTLDHLVNALPGRRFGFSSHGATRYTDVAFEDDDVLVFGSERAGLTDAAAEWISEEQMLSIPMRDGRSLNVANAAAVVVYEAWRQQGFRDADPVRGSSTVERLPLEPFDR
jgi:tRNA (cytidine/uridine-2'-O-)-methyltransferase